MYKNFRLFVMSIISVLSMGMFVSCDKDNVDDLTATLWNTAWENEDGTVYSFYKSQDGVSYTDLEGYNQGFVDQSFIWLCNGNQITVCLKGYRLENGEWLELDNDDYQFSTYDVQSYSMENMVVKSGDNTYVLTCIAR